MYERMLNTKSNQPMSDNENGSSAKTSGLVTSILRSILLITNRLSTIGTRGNRHDDKRRQICLIYEINSQGYYPPLRLVL